MRDSRPLWAILENRDVTSCPIKAALFRSQASAVAHIADWTTEKRLPADSLRAYQCYACHFWHVTKANAWANWIHSPRGWRRLDLVLEAELGARAYYIGLRENRGSAEQRRHWIETVGAAALKHRQRQAA